MSPIHTTERMVLHQASSGLYIFGVAGEEVASSELASCVPNSDARGEVALLAILGYFEGGAKDPPPKTRRGERSRG